jgi:hypothetical protein
MVGVGDSASIAKGVDALVLEKELGNLELPSKGDCVVWGKVGFGNAPPTLVALTRSGLSVRWAKPLSRVLHLRRFTSGSGVLASKSSGLGEVVERGDEGFLRFMLG